MRSRSYLFLAIVILLTAVAAFAYKKADYRYGLDIQGGVRFTFRMDTSKVAGTKRTLESIRNQELQVLENRARGSLGVAEPYVVAKGADQFIIELPGYSDINQARQVVGSTGKLIVYDAKNVVTEKMSFRPYSAEEGGNGDQVEVHFTRRNDPSGKVITPKDPEYKEVIAGWEVIAEGDDLEDAFPQPIPSGDGYHIGLKFSKKGAEKMGRWTRANQYSREKIAMFLDGVVLNIAALEQGAVITDQGSITGNFSSTYAKTVCNLLKSGSLPLELTLESSEKVDPSIGRDALDKIVSAGLIAFGVISVFMLFYYFFPGFIAVVALVLYVLFSLTVLKIAETTFSLAAIAGFILSVGMAVDANILVFERVKEEMRSGRDLHASIELGFRRALPAIVDSNACTILTALVLANLGTGPVKGFAVTLIFGVIISLFTALTVTHSLLVFLVDSGIGAKKSWFGLGRQWLGDTSDVSTKPPRQIVNKAGRYFAISALTIVPGIIFLAMGGLKPNVEFRGGYEASYVAGPNSPSSAQIIQNLEAKGVKGANVKYAEAGGQRIVYLTVPPMEQYKNSQNPAGLIAEEAGLDPSTNKDFTSVGPAVQKETLQNAIYGVLFSSGLIILYLAIRFGLGLGGFVIGLRFSTSAILALLHDILVVIGVAAITGYLFGWEVSALFISSMLTVIGFSTHDTIVIFDRIRENLRKPRRGEDAENLINRSITQSFARSINTSLTVIVTLAVLIICGSATPELKLFNAAMLIGIISGTYSSIFNASPILYLWDKAIIRKRGAEHGLMGIAAQNLTSVRVSTPTVVDTPSPSAGTGTPGYGQVKRRRASDVQASKRRIDED